MTMSMRKLFMITKLERVLLPLLWSSSFSPCKIDGQSIQSGAAPQKWSNIPKITTLKGRSKMVQKKLIIRKCSKPKENSEALFGHNNIMNEFSLITATFWIPHTSFYVKY